MPPTPQLLIIDLDGTVVDSLDDLTASVNFMRREFGLAPLERITVQGMVGKGARNLVQQALPGHGDAAVTAGLATFLAHNGEHLHDRTSLYPGVAQTLAQLRAQGHTLALLSNKHEGLCRKLLAHFRIDGHFTAVAGGDTFPERKPSPEPVSNLRDSLGFPSAATAMVGDSINDIAAGKGAGVITIGCTYGYGNPAELASADYRLDSFSGLLTLPPFQCAPNSDGGGKP